MDWRSEVKNEIDKAEKARAQGKEGQARVRARRAAGIAAREYLVSSGRYLRTASAYDLLRYVVEETEAPVSVRESAAVLTLRVDQEFSLPPGVDLIAEARRFCDGVAGTIST